MVRMNEFQSYRDYEKAIANAVLLPFFEKYHVTLKDARIGDFGCGEGGCLELLVERGDIKFGFGVDFDPAIVARTPKKSQLQFVLGDILTIKSPFPLNIILLRDVIEHTTKPRECLKHAIACLEGNGYLYISFSPYYGPFGGHQHHSNNILGKIPWVHFLPEEWFFGLLRLETNLYKNRQALEDDLRAIRRTRLSISEFESFLKNEPLRLVARQLFISRPEYFVKYDWFTLHNTDLPLWRELTTTGVEYLLQKLI